MTSWCPLCQGVCRVLVLVRAQMFIRKQMNFSPHVHHHLDWSVVVMSLTTACKAGLQRPNLLLLDPSPDFLGNVMASPEDLLWLSGFFSGFCRLEEAVPNTCLAPDFQRESDGEQQKPEAGWPVQLQLELEKEVTGGVDSAGGLGMMSGAWWRGSNTLVAYAGHAGRGEGRNSAGLQGPGSACVGLWIASKTP